MTDDAMKAVEEAARAARGTVADLASVPDERLDARPEAERCVSCQQRHEARR